MCFAYFVVFPIAFGFFAGYAPTGVQMMTDIDKYLSFVMTMFIAFGITFETPGCGTGWLLVSTAMPPCTTVCDVVGVVLGVVMATVVLMVGAGAGAGAGAATGAGAALGAGAGAVTTRSLLLAAIWHCIARPVILSLPKKASVHSPVPLTTFVVHFEPVP